MSMRRLLLLTLKSFKICKFANFVLWLENHIWLYSLFHEFVFLLFLYMHIFILIIPFFCPPKGMLQYNHIRKQVDR